MRESLGVTTDPKPLLLGLMLDPTRFEPTFRQSDLTSTLLMQ